MHILTFDVSAQQLRWANPCRGAVEGTAGAVLAQFVVDPEWDGLTIMATFDNDALMEQAEPVLWTGDPVTVPSHALSAAGRLRVGLVGLGDDGELRLTTRRMAQGIPVHPSGGTGGTAVDPDPALWEQILAIIGNMSDLDTYAKDTLVNAINEAARSGGGGGGGGIAFELGETLTLENGILDVNTDTTPTPGSDLPITSDAVSAVQAVLQTALDTLAKRLNAVADSDDISLDQLSEIVAYIKANKTLIDSVTTSKVSVADIVDALTSTAANKPLSANQGRALKALIDNLTTTKVSTSDIVNNLTSTATNKPLSAAQGRALKALIDAIAIPTKLPNPYALTFAGATSGTYDGTKAVTVTIPNVSGEPGKDGREIELRVSGGYIQWRYADSSNWTNLVSLSDLTGKPGDPGVGIQSVEQTTTSTTDGGTNIITVTLTDGTETTFRVRNGSRGGTGATPNITIGDVTTLDPGSAAEVTISGTAANPVVSFGIPAGEAGYTPKRGTDYWTANDKTEIIDSVLSALPTWEGGVY